MMNISKNIYTTFLNHIEQPFRNEFENDSFHLKLFEITKADLLSTENSSLNNLVHLIEACLSKISKTECASCKYQNNEKALTYFALYAKPLSIFFASYWGCSLPLATEVFNRFKTPCHTEKGMHTFDLCTVILQCVKTLNRKYHKNVDFLGVFYNNSPTYFNSRQIKPSKEYAILCATGTIRSPVHWYGAFVSRSGELYIYNSCPRENAFDIGVFLEMENVTRNTHQQQFENELCGFFAVRFLEAMICSSDYAKTFSEFNKKKNLDKLVEIYQKNLILIPNEEIKPVELFLSSMNERKLN